MGQFKKPKFSNIIITLKFYNLFNVGLCLCLLLQMTWQRPKRQVRQSSLIKKEVMAPSRLLVDLNNFLSPYDIITIVGL